jgi:hypothetical protein
VAAGLWVFRIVVVGLLTIIAFWEKARRRSSSTSNYLESLAFILGLSLEHIAEPSCS